MEQTGECRPLVSVIMPAYNAEKYIASAIASVQAQTFLDWELLVLDDGSTDTTAALVSAVAAKDTRIRLEINPENMGAARTRNRGLELCRGDYVALLDSDDIWHPKKLEQQLRLMTETGAALCYTSYALVDEQGRKIRADYVIPEKAVLDRMLKENIIGCSTVLMKKGLVESRRFREDFYHEDYVLWLTLLQEGYSAVGCTEVLVDWRYQETSRSYNKWRSMKNRWDIYRRAMKLPVGKSLYYLCHYAAAGLAKYKRMFRRSSENTAN